MREKNYSVRIDATRQERDKRRREYKEYKM
jgi:hypothetical protein